MKCIKCMRKIVNLRDCVSYNTENGQSDAYIISANLEIVSSLILKGWKASKQKEGYYLRAPSTWLVDMTDPFKIDYYTDLYVNFAYYFFLDELVKCGKVLEWIDNVTKLNACYYDGLEYTWTQGPIVESEFRIIGSDNRIKQLKDDLFEYFMQGNEAKKYLSYAKEYLGDINPLSIREKSLNSNNQELKKYFEHIDKIFSCHNIKIYNPQNIHFDLNLLPEYKRLILAPTGCFDFLLSVIESTNVKLDKIGYYEVHSDPKKIGFSYYNCEIEMGDAVVVLDKVYSGYSLDEMAQMVKSMGGSPIKVGMFPKSRVGIKRCDYVIIGQKIFKAEEVLSTKEWIKVYYKKAFSSEKDI